MDYVSDEKRLEIMENINNKCYLKIHPDKSEDVFNCYNCDKIKLHKLNPVIYIKDNKSMEINQVSIDYNDNQPLYL